MRESFQLLWWIEHPVIEHRTGLAPTCTNGSKAYPCPMFGNTVTIAVDGQLTC